MSNKAAFSSNNDNLTGLLFGLVGVLIFAGTLPATRIAVATFDPWFLTFARALLATLLAIMVLLVLRRRIPREHIASLFIAGILLVFGFPGFIAVAMQTVPSAHGGVVLGILPLATAIFAALLAGERPSSLFWICGVIGASLTVIFALRDGGWGFATGDIWLLLAVICASCGYVISGKLGRFMPGWEIISWALILTMPFTLLGTFFLWEPTYAEAPSRHIVAFIYLGLGSMYLGFFAWNAGLRRGGMAKVGQLQLLQTFFTLGIAAWLLGEKVTPETFAFAAAVAIVIFIGRRAQVRQK